MKSKLMNVVTYAGKQCYSAVPSFFGISLVSPIRNSSLRAYKEQESENAEEECVFPELPQDDNSEKLEVLSDEIEKDSPSPKFLENVKEEPDSWIQYLDMTKYITKPENLEFAKHHGVKLLPDVAPIELENLETVLETSRVCTDALLRYINGSYDWTELGRSKGIIMKRIHPKPSEPPVCYGQIDLGKNIDIIDAMVFFWEGNPLTYNTNLDRSFRMVDYSTSFPKGCHLGTFYQSFKGCCGVPGRDCYVTCFITNVDENTTVFTSTSIGLNQEKPIRGSENKKVRAILHLAGLCLTRNPSTGDTILHFVWQADLGGSLPTWVQKLINTGSLANVATMKTHLLKWLNNTPMDKTMDLPAVCREKVVHIDQWGYVDSSDLPVDRKKRLEHKIQLLKSFSSVRISSPSSRSTHAPSTCNPTGTHFLEDSPNECRVRQPTCKNIDSGIRTRIGDRSVMRNLTREMVYLGSIPACASYDDEEEDYCERKRSKLKIFLCVSKPACRANSSKKRTSQVFIAPTKSSSTSTTDFDDDDETMIIPSENLMDD